MAADRAREFLSLDVIAACLQSSLLRFTFMIKSVIRIDVAGWSSCVLGYHWF